MQCLFLPKPITVFEKKKEIKEKNVLLSVNKLLLDDIFEDGEKMEQAVP